MAKPRLGIASGNKLGADAGAAVAQAGGNAVDACLASGVMAWVVEPFFASVGGSGFIAVRSPDGSIEVYDGNNAMPHTIPESPGLGLKRTYLDYSNGMYTGIGGGSVAVPGILKALRQAWERHGHIEWPALFAPAIDAARNGIAFPRTSAYYLSVTYKEIWAHYPEAQALFTVDGRPMQEGESFVQPELAESLEMIAEQGPEVFYEGELAQEIADAIVSDGGFWGVRDLKQFESHCRSPIGTYAFGWRIESNPPPAVGGAVLTHMLALLDQTDISDPLERLRAIVEAERAAVGYRGEHYQEPGEIAGGLEEALERLRNRPAKSGDTTHMSSADSDGYVCSLTESNGYGAGLVVRGMMLNNTLGEEELNPLGAHRLPPGSRCHSNMAPTIATGPGVCVGIGSPGADRITGAIAQTLVSIAVDKKSLAEAVAAPRAHLSAKPEGELMCYEPGLPGDQLGSYVPRPYDDVHMFFGAVQAASVRDDGTVDAAHDPRRSGATAFV
ncbi:MAG: gamma-glutamyltransferase family protein [Actinomycetota bacterium]|nr:gamma-glutamyltransferase family protein [Actinomycetota bacterium]